jgi:uncharacterized membrane protein YeaQ/YmgE (transglycosylase-associated protein family)
MFGLIVSVMVTSFITGALARFALPGPDPMPVWLTVLIGLVGTLIGTAIVLGIVGKDPAWGGISGFLTSVALVAAYRRFVQKRPIWGREAYRFPERGVGIEQYRERLHRAGIDPDRIGNPFAPVVPQPAPARAAAAVGDDPTENPAHYLQLLEELHDSGVLNDEEYSSARMRLLERLRT